MQLLVGTQTTLQSTHEDYSKASFFGVFFFQQPLLVGFFLKSKEQIFFLLTDLCSSFSSQLQQNDKLINKIILRYSYLNSLDTTVTLGKQYLPKQHSKQSRTVNSCMYTPSCYLHQCTSHVYYKIKNLAFPMFKQCTSLRMAEKLQDAIVTFLMQQDKTCMKYLRETFLERLWDFPINHMQHLLHLITNHITPRFIRKEAENV